MISSGKSRRIALLPIAEQTAPASDTHQVLAIIKVNMQWVDRVLRPVKSHQISADLSAASPLPASPSKQIPMPYFSTMIPVQILTNT